MSPSVTVGTRSERRIVTTYYRSIDPDLRPDLLHVSLAAPLSLPSPTLPGSSPSAHVRSVDTPSGAVLLAGAIVTTVGGVPKPFQLEPDPSLAS